MSHIQRKIYWKNRSKERFNPDFSLFGIVDQKFLLLGKPVNITYKAAPKQIWH